jgi:hypothetical protein
MKQHGCDQRRDDHQMDDDNDSLHFDLSSQTKAGRQRVSVLREFEFGRVLHDCTGRCHPRLSLLLS